MTSTDRISDAPQKRIFSELDEYQALSRLAVGALVAGLFSATAMLGTILWMVPLFAVVLSLLALAMIKRSGGALVGRPLALTGLCLGICFGSAALTQYFNARRIIARQAHEAADEWFGALARNQAELACEWKAGLGSRTPVEDVDQLPAYYESHQKESDALTKFISDKPIKLLLSLGSGAHVRLMSTVSIDEALEFVSQVYEVSFQEAGKPEKFSMLLTLQRRTIPGHPSPWWRIADWKTYRPGRDDPKN
jgi:hypothetical protein